MTAVHDTPVMLFGFHHHTNVWAGRARSTTDLVNWVHVPAKNLVTLLDTLSQFPKLEVLVLDVFNELLRELSPLDLPASLSETVCGFYHTLEGAFDQLPKLKVSPLTQNDCINLLSFRRFAFYPPCICRQLRF